MHKVALTADIMKLYHAIQLIQETVTFIDLCGKRMSTRNSVTSASSYAAYKKKHEPVSFYTT